MLALTDLVNTLKQVLLDDLTRRVSQEHPLLLRLSAGRVGTSSQQGRAWSVRESSGNFGASSTGIMEGSGMSSIVPFSELEGKTITAIKDLETGSDYVTFTTESGEVYTMRYYEDCCASCSIEDIAGDVNDLIGSPIMSAYEESSGENPEGVKPEYQDSFTWTFYRIMTNKGSVVIRWYGESNGYYSESATFERVQ
jgi:hypothetical protein